MNKQELKFILQSGEGLKTEFKESAGSIDKEIVAFANSNGGRIFLGVDDKGKVKGIKITNKLKSQIQDISRNCDPQISIDLKEFNNVLIINVEEGKDKPYKCSQGFFIRQGANSQKMTRDEILDFAIGEGKIRFDEQINKNFRFPQDFDLKKLDKYLQLAGITKSIRKENVLINLGVAVLEKGKLKLNNAGVLFFTKKPEKFFLTSSVVCVNYRTDEKVDILDKKIFDDGIINNIQETINYAKKHIDVEYEIKTFKRKEIPQYPEEAVRECIVNAVMHRDYFEKGGDILIEIFRTKIDFSNPGGLVSWLDKKDFGKKSEARNRIIANLLSKTEFVEKVGTGINRIRLSMKQAGLLKPIFDFNKYSFSVLLKSNKKVGKKVGENVAEVDAKLTQVDAKLTQELSDKEKEVLSFIIQNKKITSIDLQNLLGISREMVNRYFNKLIEKKLIMRKGIGKSTYYILKR